MKKILLDTDIGTDIDDAVCLAYLLSHPECDLLGITTVGNESEKRAMLASAMCKAASKDIPIYPGLENPLIIPSRQVAADQFGALGNWDYDKNFPKNQAIDFLRRTIRENPNEITLLTIGPLTNIAVLFSIDPEIPALLKELVLMCGVFDDEARKVINIEYNSICDPHAAKIVYNANAVRHRSIGLDVTLKVFMSKSEAQEKFKAKILKPVLDFAEVWFEEADTIFFHDPLAATVIFDEEICGFDKGNVDVEVFDFENQGYTYWNKAENGKHEVAMRVDKDKFIEHYFSIVR